MADAQPDNIAVLTQLAQVQGQLTALAALIQHNHTATNQRIDDKFAAMDQRIEDTQNALNTGLQSMEKRLGVLEDRERTTAIRTAGVSVLTSALVAGAIAALKHG